MTKTLKPVTVKPKEPKTFFSKDYVFPALVVHGVRLRLQPIFYRFKLKCRCFKVQTYCCAPL